MSRGAVAVLILIGLGTVTFGVVSTWQAVQYLRYASPSEVGQRVAAVLGAIVPIGVAAFGAALAWGGLRVMTRQPAPALPVVSGFLGGICLVFGLLAVAEYHRFHSALAPMREELGFAAVSLAVGLVLVVLTVQVVRHNRLVKGESTA